MKPGSVEMPFEHPALCLLDFQAIDQPHDSPAQRGARRLVNQIARGKALEHGKSAIRFGRPHRPLR
jgi:hypothetical protein